jgi:hypothetical protein
MSALGQVADTEAPAPVSALALKADMGDDVCHVRYVPAADIGFMEGSVTGA